MLLPPCPRPHGPWTSLTSRFGDRPGQQSGGTRRHAVVTDGRRGLVFDVQHQGDDAAGGVERVEGGDALAGELSLPDGADEGAPLRFLGRRLVTVVELYATLRGEHGDGSLRGDLVDQCRGEVLGAAALRKLGYDHVADGEGGQAHAGRLGPRQGPVP